MSRINTKKKRERKRKKRSETVREREKEDRENKGKEGDAVFSRDTEEIENNSSAGRCETRDRFVPTGGDGQQRVHLIKSSIRIPRLMKKIS